MNYFAHGLRFLDRPHFLAGTAIPDLLSAVDRKVRMRSRRVEPFLRDDDPLQREIATGVLQHLHDDRWFHASPVFQQTIAELTALFRMVLDPDMGHRPGFLGHIVTELLLDGLLIDENPRLLDEYYAAIEQVDPHQLERAVNRMARNQTDRLAPLVPRFHQEQFLRDYFEPARLLFRLNQVMRRVKLPELPEELIPSLRDGRAIVAQRTVALLPQQHFTR